MGASFHYSPFGIEWAGVVIRRSDGSLVSYEFEHGASIEMSQDIIGRPSDPDYRHMVHITLIGDASGPWRAGTESAPPPARASAEVGHPRAIAPPVKALASGELPVEYRAVDRVMGTRSMRDVAEAEVYHRCGWSIQKRTGDGEWEDFSSSS